MTGLLEENRPIRPSKLNGAFIVRPGTSVALEGAANGRPSPVARFLKDGEMISAEGKFSYDRTSDGGLRLVIDDVTTAENGTYTFVAENEAGSVGSSVDVLVEGRLSMWPIYSIDSDSSLFLLGTSGYPLIGRRPGRAPVLDGNTITAVVGTNENVLVQMGRDLGLVTEVTGDGPFEITWTRGDNVLTTSSYPEPVTHTLNLNDFRKNAAGTYKVTVSNNEGSDTEEIDLLYDVPGKLIIFALDRFICNLHVIIYSTAQVTRSRR